MPFDVMGAKKAGYSLQEIGDHVGFDVTGAIKAGYSENEIINHLASSDTQPQPSDGQFRMTREEAAARAAKGAAGFLPEGAPQVSKFYQENPSLYGAAGATYETAKALLPALGMTGAGLAAGISTKNPYQAITAGATGYAGGKMGAEALGQMLDVVPQTTIPEALIGTGKALQEGAEAEMLGGIGSKVMGTGAEGLGKLYKYGKRFLGSKEAEVGRIISKERTQSEPFITNIKQAEALQKEVPGLELTYGQKSDFPAAVRSETVTARKENLGALLFKQIESGNQKALDVYVKNKLPGVENIDDVIKTIKPRIDNLRASQRLAQADVDNMLADLPSITAEGVQARGGALRNVLNKLKTDTWKQAQERYSLIDDVSVNSDDILNGLKEYEQAVIARGESPSVFPSGIIKQLEQNQITQNIMNPGGSPLFKQEYITNFNQLRGLRGQAYKIASETKDYQLANNARTIGQIIDEGMEKAAEKIGGDLWSNFRNAQDFYNKEYIGKFRLGTVGDVLKSGRDAMTRYAKTDSEVIGEFFRGDKKAIERIDDLIRVTGPDRVKDLLRDYAAFDLRKTATNPSTGEIVPQKLAGWFAKNEAILGKAGIKQEFENIADFQKVADIYATKTNEFENSIAGKLLGVDPQKAIATAFTGKGGKATEAMAKELISLVGNDKAALNGIKNSFRDFLLSQVKNTAKDIAGGEMISPAKANKIFGQYLPAIQTFWKDEPEKIKALQVFRNVSNIIARNKASQFAGSQTTEFKEAAKALESLPFMGYEGVVFRAVMRVRDIIGEHKMTNLLTQARFDPNFADHMIRIAKQADSARTGEGFRSAIERFLNLESSIGGKSEAMGRAMGVQGITQIPNILNQETPQ